MADGLVKVKVSELPQAASLDGLVVLGVSGANQSVQVPILLLKGNKGDSGPALEMRTTATHMQWRVIGSATWNNIVALSDLKGDTGANVEFQTSATHIQWRVVGASAWTNLVALSDLKGAKGDPGENLELQKTATHVQWRVAGGIWANLIALSDLKGEPGDGSGNVVVINNITGETAKQYFLKPKSPGSLQYDIVEYIPPSVPARLTDLTDYENDVKGIKVNNAGNADTVNEKSVAADVPANAKFTDTTYSEISESEIDAGTSVTLRTITARRLKYVLNIVQGWINALTKSDVGLSNVDNVQQATKTEFNSHDSDSTRHVTSGDKTTWNNKLSSAGYSDMESDLTGRVALTSGAVNWNSGAVFTRSLTANTTLSFSNLRLNKVITLIITGNSRTLNFPASVKVVAGEYDAGAVNYIQLHCTNTSPAEVWCSISQEVE